MRKKRSLEKEDLIRQIIESLSRCPYGQLLIMYDVLGMAAGAAKELAQASEVLKTDIGFKLHVVGLGNRNEGSQTEFKS